MIDNILIFQYHGTVQITPSAGTEVKIALTREQLEAIIAFVAGLLQDQMPDLGRQVGKTNLAPALEYKAPAEDILF